MTIIIRSVFEEGGKLYLQVFLDDSLYECTYKCYVNAFMLIKQVHRKNSIYHFWYFEDSCFKYEPYLCNGCHDLMQRVMRFNDVAIVYAKENPYRIHFWYMNKNDAISLMNNSNLVDKKGAL